IDFKMNVQEAVEAPRWLSGRFTIGDPVEILRMERRFPQSTVERLESMGHKVTCIEEWSQIVGHAQAIMINRTTGVMTGGADPRGDSAAVGW
ncbi:MAG: gamma-glutamyltransferase, partial [Candidatus Jordarchaeaceae archaeon]